MQSISLSSLRTALQIFLTFRFPSRLGHSFTGIHPHMAHPSVLLHHHHTTSENTRPMKQTRSLHVSMLSVSHHLLRVSIKTESSKSFNRENLQHFFQRTKCTCSEYQHANLWFETPSLLGMGVYINKNHPLGKVNFNFQYEALLSTALLSLPNHTFYKIATASVGLFSPLPLKKPNRPL